MKGTEFDELRFFRAIGASGVRALLIGRRALVVLGLPVLTADYDFWIHRDDIAAFNEAVRQFDLFPTRARDDALRMGRYALENDERVDVLVATAVTARTGEVIDFASLWDRRQSVALTADVAVTLPALDDLITTKRFALRPKDVEDIRLLEILRRREGR